MRSKPCSRKRCESNNGLRKRSARVVRRIVFNSVAMRASPGAHCPWHCGVRTQAWTTCAGRRTCNVVHGHRAICCDDRLLGRTLWRVFQSDRCYSVGRCRVCSHAAAPSNPVRARGRAAGQLDPTEIWKHGNGRIAWPIRRWIIARRGLESVRGAHPGRRLRSRGSGPEPGLGCAYHAVLWFRRSAIRR